MKKRTVVSAFVTGAFLGFTFSARVSATELFALENGDANGDWEMDLSDAIYVLDWLFAGGPEPVPIACGTDIAGGQNGDTNGDGGIDLSDGVYLLRWLFTGGPAPRQIPCLIPALAGDEMGTGARAVQRSMEEFVAAQGTFCPDPSWGCVPDEPTDCCLFVPPIRNFIGWGDPASLYYASFDYAGLADAWITQEGGAPLGTAMDGSVTERPLPDGRAEVHVRLHTKNALVWAFLLDPSLPGNPWRDNPLSFGHRAPEVLAGADAALGESLFHVVFINSAPGAPLPDILQVFYAPEEGQEGHTMCFYGRADGTLRELYGVPDGTPGRVQVTQTGLLALPSQSPSYDGFPAEKVSLQVVGQ
jgi:hypothetical protein